MANAPAYLPPRDAHSLAPSGIAPQTQRKRVLWWHDAIIDVMLANPGWTIKKIAEHLKRKPQTLYLVTNSDVFRARLAMRRAEHAKNLSTSVIEKTTRVADKALELALNRLESESSAQIPTLQLFSLADKALERLGYGSRPSGPSVVVNNVNGTQQNAYMSVPADVIRDSQQRMREEQAARAASTPSVDARPQEPDTSPPSGEGGPLVIDVVANPDRPSGESSS